MTNHPNRPDCWEFAMSFIGDPERAEIDRYVEALEAAQRPVSLADVTWPDIDFSKMELHPVPPPDQAPAGSLVERVALTRMNPPLDEDDMRDARAAIREVAAWMQERTGTIANGSQWADMLRDQADR